MTWLIPILAFWNSAVRRGELSQNIDLRSAVLVLSTGLKMVRSSVLVLGLFGSRGHRYWYWVLGSSGVAVMPDPSVLVLSTDLKDLRSSGTGTGYWVVGFGGEA